MHSVARSTRSAASAEELFRAIRREAARDPRLPLDALLARAGEVIDALALLPLDRGLLLIAGALAEPALRAPRRLIGLPGGTERAQVASVIERLAKSCVLGSGG